MRRPSFPFVLALAALAAGRAHALPVVYEVRAPWEEAAVANGAIRRLGPRYRTLRALETLAEALGLDEAPYRIECFDISNIQGADTVASMVVWEGGKPRKSDYRT